MAAGVAATVVTGITDTDTDTDTVAVPGRIAAAADGTGNSQNSA